LDFLLLLPPPERHLCVRIARSSETHRDRARLYAWREFPVVLEEEVTEHDLELVSGKESAGARVVAVPEAHVVRTGSDEMGKMLLPRILTHPHKAVRVEAVRVLPDTGGPHKVIRDDESGPGRDLETVR
jgi:hypothetical protein